MIFWSSKPWNQTKIPYFLYIFRHQFNVQDGLNPRILYLTNLSIYLSIFLSIWLTLFYGFVSPLKRVNTFNCIKMCEGVGYIGSTFFWRCGNCYLTPNPVQVGIHLADCLCIYLCRLFLNSLKCIHFDVSYSYPFFSSDIFMYLVIF